MKQEDIQKPELKQKEEKHNWTDDFVHYWKYYLAPSRISLSEKEFIRNKIEEKIKKYGSGKKHLVKILVMGATPEYRQLCGEMDIPVTLFDFSRYNYEYLGQEVKNKPKEKFIEGNWLMTIPTENCLNENHDKYDTSHFNKKYKKYDIILADNALNVVMKNNHLILYANVCNLLKDDGFFMPRTFVRELNERWTGEKVIEEYRKEANGKPLYTWTFRHLVMAVYNYNLGFCVFKDIWTEIKKLHEKGIITSKELEEFSKWSMENREFKVYVPEREELNKMLKQFFTIKETFFGAEPYLKNMLPFHVLVKKTVKNGEVK
ncbi:hypothetical protein HY636_00015 [Candidatus Woesearchaeota archaeon]|nr:hypothetical protein [Candidatus Woesearchaeota archaeon]